MTEKPSDKTPAYISRCKCGCGGIIMATVDKPEYANEVADDVAQAIRDGYVIERVTAGYVQDCGGVGCLRERARRRKEQQTLPGIDQAQ